VDSGQWSVDSGQCAGAREQGKRNREWRPEGRRAIWEALPTCGDWSGGMGALAINYDVREGPGYFRIGDEGIGVEAPRMRT